MTDYFLRFKHLIFNSIFLFFTLSIFSNLYADKNNIDLNQYIKEIYAQNTLDSILSHTRNKQFVLIGDSTHGTHEFYQARIDLTKQLILQNQYKLIAIEASWADVYLINQYIHGKTNLSLRDVFSVFKRYPEWMWKNQETLYFVEWLKDYNSVVSKNNPNNLIHFYGIDLYGYCPCPAINDNVFLSVNALVRKNHYRNEQLMKREMSQSDQSVASWNLRDLHMFDMLEELMFIYHQPKTIVWAHNAHAGDSRATNKSEVAQLNLAQLLRQYYAEQVFTIGMFTYQGDVIASDAWGGKHGVKSIKPADSKSVEGLFHTLNQPEFALYTEVEGGTNSVFKNYLNKIRLARHIGVVYDPYHEYESHYIQTQLANEFDLIFYFDTTHPITLLPKTKTVKTY